SQRGGSIRIWTRGWGVGTSTGIRIKAGGGAVAIGPIHINGAAWNIDISGANPLTVENSFFLNHDTSTGPAGAHGNLRIAASKNVTIANNIFHRSVRYANSGRTTVFIGPGVSNVTIANNTFDEG